jgi:hypothetical protein
MSASAIDSYYQASLAISANAVRDDARTPTVTEIKKQKSSKSKKDKKPKHKKNLKSDGTSSVKDASAEDELIKNIRASRKLDTLDLSDDEA